MLYLAMHVAEAKRAILHNLFYRSTQGSRIFLNQNHLRVDSCELEGGSSTVLYCTVVQRKARLLYVVGYRLSRHVV